MLNAAALFGPCHGLVQHALATGSWLYVRDICSNTRLPRNTVECVLVQLVESGLVIKDATLNRYSLARISTKEIYRRLGHKVARRCSGYIVA